MRKSSRISLLPVVVLVSLIVHPTFAQKKPPPTNPNQTPSLHDPPKYKDPLPQDPREQKDQQPPWDPTEQKTRQPSLDQQQKDPPPQDPREQKDQQPPHDPTEQKAKQPPQDQHKKDPLPQDPREQKDQQPPQDPTEQKAKQPPQDQHKKDPPPQDPREQKDQQPPQDPTEQKDQQLSQIPRNTPPRNPKQPLSPIPKRSPPPIPENHLPQNPKIKPPQDQIPSPRQDEPQRPTPFHNRFKGHFTTICAFGDSYTDTGNAQSMGSLTPSFSDSKSSPYGSNRLSDGRLVIDYITDSFGLPVLPPYQSTTANFTHGVNFAIAGSTALAGELLSKLARFFLSKGAPLSVMIQLDWYKKFQKDHLCKGLDQKACADKMKTTLFWIGEIGINDYSRAVGSKIPLSSIAQSTAAYTIEFVRVCIANSIPPIGCLPLDISVTPLINRDKWGCSPIVNGAVIIHNQILKAKLESYRKLSPDVTIIYADSWKAYYTIVNDPEKYKILETQKTCCGSTIKPEDMNFNIQSLCGSLGTTICGDPSQYISWDGIHPTESMNSHMTDQFINNGCCKPPFQELMKRPL